MLMFSPFYLVLFISYSFVMTIIEATPLFLTYPQNCGRLIQEGTVIMGNAAVSSTARSVIVTRNGVLIPDGSSYIPGEQLVASISSTAGKYLLEVKGGAVVSNAGCGDTRIALSDAIFTIPSTQTTGNITIVTAWTTAKTTPVSISSTFTLTAPPPPTATPTMIPGATSAPSSSHHPTYPPSVMSGMTPSSPTAATDDTTQSNLDESSLSALPDGFKWIIGLLIGIVGFSLIFYIAYRVAYNRVNFPDTRHISEKTIRFSRISSALAICVAISATIMVVQWTKKPTESDPWYLDKPSWSKNIFAWHPVLMIGGLFFSQVNAITSWSIYPIHPLAKYIHLTWHIGGISMMFLAFHAIRTYKERRQELHFTSMHSWIGAGAIAFVCFSMIWGISVATLMQFWPDSIFRQAYDLRSAHKNIGSIAIMGTTLAIVTGIMDQMPHGTCDPELTKPKYVSDSARYYQNVLGSCRLSHGLGIVVILAAGLTLVTVAYRGDSFGRSRLENDLSVTSKELKAKQSAAALEDSTRRLKERVESKEAEKERIRRERDQQREVNGSKRSSNSFSARRENGSPNKQDIEERSSRRRVIPIYQSSSGTKVVPIEGGSGSPYGGYYDKTQGNGDGFDSLEVEHLADEI